MKKKISILVIVFILLASNLSYGSSSKVKLVDVKSTDWYAATILKLMDLGGIEGYPDNSFKPNNSITKAEFIKALVTTLGMGQDLKTNEHWASGYISKAQILNILDKNATTNIDQPISRKEVAEIVSNTLVYLNEIFMVNSDCITRVTSKGIMVGYPDGSFKDGNSLTRAEASTIIVRIIDKNMRLLANNKPIDVHNEILKLINIERKKKNLSPLVICSQLSEVAELKSKDMALENYFEHISPKYGTPFNMMNEFGIVYKAAAENIAKGYKTSEDVVKGWMESPGHRANILNSDYHKMGIGLYTSDTSYWTQMFTN